MNAGIRVTVTVKVNTARLEQLLKMLRPKADMILDKCAFDIEATAKGLAPVDTGALRASIYVAGASGRQGGVSSAQGAARRAGLNKGRHSGQTRTNISFSEPPSIEELQRAIGPAVSYAIFPEIQGQPYMRPAAEANRQNFIRAWYAFV